MQQRRFFTGIAFLMSAKLELSYLYEAFDEGIKQIPEVDQVVKGLMGVPGAMEFSFYAFMTYAAAYSKMRKKEQFILLM